MLQPPSKQGKIYLNPVHTDQKLKGFGKVLWQYITSKEERVPLQAPGPFITNPAVYNKAPENGLRITWMGHSSLLIEVDGCRLLTDPVIGRASFVQFAGPKRFFPYPIALDSLPPLDAVILSHDHYDHLDKLAILQLQNSRVPFICSAGVGPIIERWGIDRSRITEVSWMDKVSAGSCSITATPARHFSGRGIINRNQTLWSSFVIKGTRHSLFFGADSGWFPGFKDIGDSFGPFDLTMLEVGAYGEGWPDIHMGPDHATNAHLALKGKLMMPIHWGTFNLALHHWREPVELSQQLAKQKNISLFLPEPGLPTPVMGPVAANWWLQ